MKRGYFGIGIFNGKKHAKYWNSLEKCGDIGSGFYLRDRTPL